MNESALMHRTELTSLYMYHLDINMYLPILFRSRSVLEVHHAGRTLHGNCGSLQKGIRYKWHFPLPCWSKTSTER